MKKILTILLFLAMGATLAEAQSIASKRQDLASYGSAGGHVVVEEDAGVAEAVTAVEAQRRISAVNGYRVVIFSDNGQYAGDAANEVVENFRANYPTINAYLVYESPYFKVSVGDCLTMEEAQMLMARILHQYPKACPKRESIKLEELANVRKEEPTPESIDSLVMPLEMPRVDKIYPINL